MWYFVEEDGHCSNEADVFAGEERGANCEAVGEVVKKVCKEVEVAGHPHLLFLLNLFLALSFCPAFRLLKKLRQRK